MLKREVLVGMFSDGSRRAGWGVLDARGRAVGLLAATAGLLALWALVFAGPAAASSSCGTSGVFSQSGLTATCTYTSQGTEDTFTVPGSVSSVSVTAVGGQGGQGPNGGAGGLGARVVNTALPITAGATLYVDVGQSVAPSWWLCPAAGGKFDGGNNGTGACDGGAGGGSSAVLLTPRASATLTGNPATDSRLLVAGAGGGTGYNTFGGSAGDTMVTGAGAGGGPRSNGGPGGVGPTDGTNGGGAGATSGCLGAASGATGSATTGGNADGFASGGGGGGWFGGGGGCYNGGGGGGSSYGGAGPSSGITIATATATTGPSVAISYTAPAADLSITNSAPSSVVSGNTLTYTITATNNGGQDATGVTVTDPFSGNEHLNLVSASTTQGACTTKAGAVKCSVGSLSGSSNATITIVAVATTQGTFSNTATVTASNVAADTDDSSTPVMTTVIGN
jgi:uncharacterized repeat protein (TIGR01451 family)